MAFWTKPESPSPHPIGGVPEDVERALTDIEALRLQQRKVELEHAGASVSRIVACHPEATLYLLEIRAPGLGQRTQLRAMTGWRWRMPSGAIEVRYESGFRESPSEWAVPREEGVELATGDDLKP